MDQEDYGSRWYRGLMGGKSPIQRQLEKELEERRAAHPKFKAARKPLKWYWWVAIGLGLLLWIAVAFWADARFN